MMLLPEHGRCPCCASFMPSAQGQKGRIAGAAGAGKCSRMEQVYRDVTGMTTRQARFSSLSEVAPARWPMRLQCEALLFKCNVEIPQTFIDKTKQSFAELDKK
ncbi:hypothetical protein [Janthinobacterium sp. RA13]|uniref:hypothetical protein n=1 Tax=Janthinobacterium sp. RA13 TaxID=1502762 RepID=UPI0013775EC2|nr:hypothetical protein [Janthinobacterium sp. RA13]